MIKRISYICIGHEPIAGCGKILTNHERKYYGTSCENCEELWSKRIDDWKAGAEDAELDAMFSIPMTKQ